MLNRQSVYCFGFQDRLYLLACIFIHLYLQTQDYQKNFRNEKKNPPDYTFMLVNLLFFPVQALKAALF